MRLLSLVLNLILVSAYFFNSQYPEPETAETVLSLSPFFRWGCYFRRYWRLCFWKGLFEGLGNFYVGCGFFLFSFEGRATHGSLCFFLYILTWIPREMNPTGRKISWKCHIIPSFRMLMRIFLQTQTLFAVAFLGGQKPMKTQFDSDTERKIAYHASEKQTKVCLNLSIHMISFYSPGSSSRKTFRCLRCIVYFKSTKIFSSLKVKLQVHVA